jgi:hypothetical protein
MEIDDETEEKSWWSNLRFKGNWSTDGKANWEKKNCKNYYLRALPVCGSKILITRMSPDSETEASTMEHNSQKSNATTLARLQNSKSCTVQKAWVPESSTHQTRTKAWKLKNINNASVWIGSNYSAYRQPEFHIQIIQIWRVFETCVHKLAVGSQHEGTHSTTNNVAVLGPRCAEIDR